MKEKYRLLYFNVLLACAEQIFFPIPIFLFHLFANQVETKVNALAFSLQNQLQSAMKLTYLMFVTPYYPLALTIR